MIDIRIYVENDTVVYDETVYVDCKLPCVPQIDSYISLGYTLIEKLNKQWKKSSNKKAYLEDGQKEVDWEEVTKEVKTVLFNANNSLVIITVGDLSI